MKEGQRANETPPAHVAILQFFHYIKLYFTKEEKNASGNVTVMECQGRSVQRF